MTSNTDEFIAPRPSDLMTARQLGLRWSKSQRTLQRWRSEGYGPPYILIGGTVHYQVGDVLDFEARQRRGGGV